VVTVSPRLAYMVDSLDEPNNDLLFPQSSSVPDGRYFKVGMHFLMGETFLGVKINETYV